MKPQKDLEEGIALFWALHQEHLRDWDALRAYIHQAPENEAWLLLRLLSGHYWYPRTPPHTLLSIATHFTHLPKALLLQSARETSDTAEALTLILIPPNRPPTHFFAENLTDWLLYQLPALLRSEEQLVSSLPTLWQSLSLKEAFFLHKLLLHSAHLQVLRPTAPRRPKSALLLSLLRLRWPFPETFLLSRLRTHLEPPHSASPYSLF